MQLVRDESEVSVRRLANAFQEPRGSVGRWVCESQVEKGSTGRARPVSGDEGLREKVQMLCDEPRHALYGHRRIKALLKRRYGIKASRKTVLRITSDLKLKQDRIWHKPYRPKRVEKMSPDTANQAWQIDMTSFQLSDLTPLFLVVVIDCCTREIVGWTLDRRCRASEWLNAVRIAQEERGLLTKESCAGLTLRSDNGAQPCSKKFVEYLGSAGIKGQYTGYNAPDDNAFVERIMRTIKEEEVWPNVYDTFTEARDAIDAYVRFYNTERIHSSLNYQTPSEVAAEKGVTLIAA